jgi:hypothetical protein
MAIRSSSVSLALLLVGLASATAPAETLILNNPFELKIQNNGVPSTVGANVANYFLDGGNPVAGDPNTGPGDSAHAYDFVRFDELFAGPAALPAGATILNATLQMTTSTVNNAQTGGVFGVAPLVAPFTDLNVYADYTGPGVGLDAGPSFVNGHVGRPSGGFSGLTTPGSIGTPNVTLLLNDWAANPSSAHGFAISARTTDGWSVSTVGNASPDVRPALQIEYTTVPTTTLHFQQGVNGYGGNSAAHLDDNGTTTDGAFLANATFLDGSDGVNSRDVQALLKFDDIFGNLEGRIKSGDNILRAYLVLTTGSSTDAHSNGAFDIHRMLVNWDATSTYLSFGGDGPTVAQGEITDPVSSVRGMTQAARMLFDVTAAVQSWQGGAENFGLNVQANTTDGWSIFYNGATDPTVRPELIVITTTVPEPGVAILFLLASGACASIRPRRGNLPTS